MLDHLATDPTGRHAQSRLSAQGRRGSSPLAANTTSLDTAHLPVVPDHRDFNRITSDPENHFAESSRPIQSHGVQNPVAPSRRSRYAETLSRKKNHHYNSAFPRNSNSTSCDPSNRPSYEVRLITSVPTLEAHLRAVFLLEPRSR